MFCLIGLDALATSAVAPAAFVFFLAMTIAATLHANDSRADQIAPLAADPVMVIK